MKTTTLAVSLLAVAPAAAAVAGRSRFQPEGKSISFTSVPGYFVQDDPATSPTGFDYVGNHQFDYGVLLCLLVRLETNEPQAAVNFGLINRTYPTDSRFDPKGEKTQWQRFEAYVKNLNSGCGKKPNVEYKVLFLGRHGEGWHNAAESFYGTPAWNVSLSFAPTPG
jgi:hypothetical protein